MLCIDLRLSAKIYHIHTTGQNKERSCRIYLLASHWEEICHLILALSANIRYWHSAGKYYKYSLAISQSDCEKRADHAINSIVPISRVPISSIGTRYWHSTTKE